MRRDRILQCAVAAALGVVSPLAYGGADPRLQAQLNVDSPFLANIDFGAGGMTGINKSGSSDLATSATWVTPFNTVNNGTTLAGSWNNVLNWSPQVVPDGGGTATFVSNGDRSGNTVFLDIN